MSESAIVDKKKRKRTKKKNKNSSSSSDERALINTDEIIDDSDNEDDDLFNYLKVSTPTSQSERESREKLATVDLNAYQSNHMDDPINQTISLVTLKSKSIYSVDRITDLIHRMFDAGLKYDNVDAVLLQLRKEDEDINSKVAPPPPSIQQTKEKQQSTETIISSLKVDTSSNGHSLKDYSENSSAPVTISSSTVPIPPVKVPASPLYHPAPPPRSNVSVVSPTPQLINTGSLSSFTSQSNKLPEYSLSARLELAASHPNVAEALLALETWCRLVGPNTASKEFFECQALEILLQAFVSSPLSLQEQNIKTSLRSLFAHIFPSPSTSLPESSSSTSALFVLELENFFSQLSQLTVLQISSEKSSPLAIRLSDSLRAIHAIFQKEQLDLADNGSVIAIDTDILTTQRQMNDLYKKLGGDKFESINVTSSKDVPIRDILQLSDLTQELLNLQLQKHSSELQARSDNKGLKPFSPTKSLVPSKVNNISSIKDKDLETNILSSSGSSRKEIDNLKAQASQISVYYERISDEQSKDLKPYLDDFIKCQSILAQSQLSYEHTKLQLRNIESEIKSLQEQSLAIQDVINRKKLQHASRINDLNQSHAEVVQAIEKDKQVQSVLESLRTLENNLNSKTNEIWGKSKVSSFNGQSYSEVKVEAHNIQEVFETYIVAELKCVEYLSSRYLSLQKDTVRYQREVGEYVNLGMKNLAADIQKSLELVKENMNEDAAALSGVQESICEFMIKLKQAIRNEFKTFSQKAMLNLFKIATSLQSCGVVLLPQLADYVNYKPIAVQSKQIIVKDDSVKDVSSSKSQQSGSSSGSGKIGYATENKKTEEVKSPLTESQPSQNVKASTTTTETEKSSNVKASTKSVTTGETENAPLPPRKKRGNGNDKSGTPVTSSDDKSVPSSSPPVTNTGTRTHTPPKTKDSSQQSRGITPPPGLPAPSPSKGWGSIPKVTDPFTISRDKASK